MTVTVREALGIVDPELRLDAWTRAICELTELSEHAVEIELLVLHRRNLRRARASARRLRPIGVEQ